jgi:predicted alpha/beta-hydrolase family hydrolase
VSEYIKFACEHEKMPAAAFPGFDELNKCRSKLRQLGLIGVDANGIGFGNVSLKDSPNGFHITGSGTGEVSELTPADYTKVIAYDFARNWLRCEGPAIASSESLTHASVYESEPAAGAVIHAHHARLWTTLLNHAPTTAKTVAYGTPEMAYAVQDLFKNSEVKEKKIFVMGGHEEGVVTFGKTPGEALGVLEREINDALPAKPFFLFAAGAGAPSTHPWMQRWKDRLATIGRVALFDYPYMREKRKRPDRLPQLIAAHREALAQNRQRDDGAIVLIGKSMGGRIGCHVALEDKVDTLVCFGYPLCAAGDRTKLRDEVLRALRTRILFIQGTRDPLCPLDLLERVRTEMKAANILHVVEGGDHSLTVAKRQLQIAGETQQDVDQRILNAIAKFQNM